MPVPSFAVALKDPDATEDFGFNWADYLGADTISTSSWTAYTTGWDATSEITIDSDAETTTTTTVWLSSGTKGKSYYLTNRIVTAGGRTVDRTLKVVVAES